MNNPHGDNVDKTVGKVWICNTSVTIVSGFNEIVTICALSLSHARTTENACASSLLESDSVFGCPYTAKVNLTNDKKDRGGSVSRLNFFYFVIQIIVHRNEDPVLFRDRPDCPGEDLYLRRLLPDPVLRHRGHGVRGE